MQQIHNGISATQLHGVVWYKSRRSNPSGNCVELAELADGRVAMRNSRNPTGPALVYTADEMSVFISAAKGGDLDGLLRTV